MKSLQYLNKFLWKYKWRFLLGIIFIVGSNIVGATLPMIIRDALNKLQELFGAYDAHPNPNAFYDNEILPFAVYLVLLYVGMALLKGVFVFLMRQTIIIMSRHIEYDLKEEIYMQYQRLSLAFYKRNQTGDLMNRISEDVSKVRMYLGPAIMYTINLVVLFIIVISFMLQTNVELTLYTLIPLPIMSVIIYFVSSTINKRSEAVQRQQSKGLPV